MDLLLDGATRLIFIVGDPIAQVKSPAGVSQELQRRGQHALVLPAHVTPADLAGWLAAVSCMKNLDGLIATVPHKFACFEACASTTDRAGFVRSANVMRRRPDGQWHGDMCDGQAHVAAMQAKGCTFSGRRALLAGAGGAGSAIAHALVQAGVAELAIHDSDTTRRDALVARLSALGTCAVRAGSGDPRGFDIVSNATPLGMREGDPLPFDVSGLDAGSFASCVVTVPAVTPWIAAARARGCATSTGMDMFASVRDLMIDFLLQP